MGTRGRSVGGGAKRRRGRGRRLGLGAGRMRSPVAVTCIVFESHMWRRLRPLEVLRKSKDGQSRTGFPTLALAIPSSPGNVHPATHFT